MLVAEGFLRFHRVGRDAEHCGSGLGKGIPQPREVDRFPGAAGGIGAWIKKQHQFLAGISASETLSPPSRGKLKAGALAPSTSIAPGAPRSRRPRSWKPWPRKPWSRQTWFRQLWLSWPAATKIDWILTVSMRAYATFDELDLAALPDFLTTALPGLAAGALTWPSRPGPFWFRCWAATGRRGRNRFPHRFLAGLGGGFLARFLGHTPSFRRFPRINH